MRRRVLVAACAAILAGAAAQAQSIKVGLFAEPSSMDPHYHNLGPNNAFSANIYDSLVLQDESQKLQPGLAVSWKPINDTTWEFKLREGVKFHDGSDFNADDVIFSMERAQNVPNSPSSFALYLKGKTFKKVDDYTIHAITEEPYPLMPTDLSQMVVISNEVGADVTTTQFNSGEAAIGTGQYKFVEWKPGNSIVIERNPDYWGDKADFERIEVKPIKSDPSRVAALLAGDVDFIDNVPTTDIEHLKSQDNIALAQGISNRIIYLHMDRFRDDSPFITGTNSKNPLNDLKVRQAISKAINRDLIVERVMEGVAIPAGQLLPEGMFGTTDKLKPEPYDPEAAKKLLADAGYPDGFGMTIHGPNDRYINDAKILQAVGQMLTRVGLDIKVETLPQNVFFKAASSGGPDNTPKFSFILVGWGSGTGEASSPLKSLIHTVDKERGFGASNRGRYSNPEVDKLIEEALATVDDEKRADLLAQATELAISDLAIIPLHFQVNTWATRKDKKLEYLPRTDEATQFISLKRTAE
jgi:peptide/nickel transport system substrate-binding protein